MTIVRQNRNYFTGGEHPRGTAYRRFRSQNIPDEAMFRQVFNSLLMPAEKDDTAALNVAGHAKRATDIEVQNRQEIFGDGHTRFVMPHQLPDGQAFYFIDVPRGSCGERVYTDGQNLTEKILHVPAGAMAYGQRMIITTYFCSSVFADAVAVGVDLHTDIAEGSFWGSQQDLYPPVGTGADPYDTTNKAIIVLDIDNDGFSYVNAYNEYHKHGDGEFISGRSCCYSGEQITEPTDLTNGIYIKLHYTIPVGGSTYTYGRTEVQIVNTTNLVTI